MVKLKNDQKPLFYSSEIRDCYTVSQEMKKVWAIELDLLKELISVLEKHNINYYAFAGTLLGAVRHHGMIPWDDDIDIVLFRKDYERFRKIAKKEFRSPYFFQDEYSDPGILNGHSKLRNSETTAILVDYLKPDHGRITFNSGIFVDIFVLDNIPDNRSEMLLWQKKLQVVASKAWKTRKIIYRLNDNDSKKIWLKSFILRKLGIDSYYFHKYDKLLGKYKSKKTKNSVVYNFYSRFPSSKWVIDNNAYDESVILDFEGLKISCPRLYDKVLRDMYGDYHIYVKNYNEHGGNDGVFFDTVHDYKFYFDANGCLDRKKVLTTIEENGYII